VHRKAENGIIIKIIGHRVCGPKMVYWKLALGGSPLGLLETWTGKGRIGLYSSGCCSYCLDFWSDVMLLDIQSHS